MRTLRLIGLLFVSLISLAGCTPGDSGSGTLLGGSTSRTASGPGPVVRDAKGVPIVRVRLIADQTSAQVSASANPLVKIESEPVPMNLQISGRAISVNLNERGWVLGGLQRGRGVMSITPTPEGSIAVNGKPYRGTFRFVPISSTRFDIVNDVEIDSYLKSVVSKELLKDWHPEAFRAQAIVARTYALYEIATVGVKRHWDVYDDERSQVYGGLSSESSLSKYGVDSTRGVVLGYGDPGKETVFKAYFSACCGGIGQSATDAFGDPPFPPLAEKNAGNRCADSPRYNWGPVTLTKAELTRRFRVWGETRNRSEATISTISRIAPSHQNRFGRPVRYLITDNKGTRYSLIAEELRNAINAGSEGRTVWSGFIFIRDNGPSFTFTGRGSGHAAGMCQYCAQAMALQGIRHEDIVRQSFPGARLIRAY